MIKYFVRTTLERELHETYKQIDYSLFVDTEHKPIESFIKQLEQISDYDSVLLEDDLILCKDFKERVEEVISKYPEYIINFFTNPNYYVKTGLYTNFSYNQCTYYPKGIGKIISNEMKKIKDHYKDYGYDTLEHLVLKKLKLKFVIYRPCLVQHIDYKSLITPGMHSRRTPYFIDYLDELGIPYSEAFKHKEELIKLMNKKFNDF
jgi:hypothetical protein